MIFGSIGTLLGAELDADPAGAELAADPAGADDAAEAGAEDAAGAGTDADDAAGAAADEDVLELVAVPELVELHAASSVAAMVAAAIAVNLRVVVRCLFMRGAFPERKLRTGEKCPSADAVEQVVPSVRNAEFGKPMFGGASYL